MKDNATYVKHPFAAWLALYWKYLAAVVGILLVVVGASVALFAWYAPAGSGPYPLVTQQFSPNWAVQQTTVKGSKVIAIRQQANPAGPLLLFFPATGAAPSQYLSFEQTAAQVGYHVLAIPYSNMRTERSLCTDNPYCYGDYRHQQLSGEPPARGHPRPNSSIQATIINSIHQLQRTDTMGKWNTYLKGSTIQWNQTVLAGHSQGGGVAAYIAHQYDVQGVIMMSSPNDTFPPARTIATWLTAKSKTPVTRYFGFMDTHDVYAQSTQTSWVAMFGPITVHNIDKTTQYAHRFLSTSVIHFPDRLTAHFAVAQDKRYVPVWKYLLTEAKQH